MYGVNPKIYHPSIHYAYPSRCMQFCPRFPPTLGVCTANQLWPFLSPAAVYCILDSFLPSLRPRYRIDSRGLNGHRACVRRKCNCTENENVAQGKKDALLVAREEGDIEGRRTKVRFIVAWVAKTCPEEWALRLGRKKTGKLGHGGDAFSFVFLQDCAFRQMLTVRYTHFDQL
jgi:hypothetical protein